MDRSAEGEGRVTVRLALLVPFGRHAPDIAFHNSWFQTLAYLQGEGIETAICHEVGNSDVGSAREKLLWRAYHTDATHFLYIDDDIGWQPQQVKRLINSGHDFCAGIYPKKSDKLEFPFYPMPGTPVFDPVSSFVEIAHCGFGFTMLRREAITSMIKHYHFDLHYVDVDEDRNGWGLFINMICERGDGVRIRMSEDVSFCQRWRDIGGRIWADPDADLIHAGRKEYRGTLRDVLRPA